MRLCLILHTPPPDLSPTDYHYFNHLDTFIKDKIFENQTAAENAFIEFVSTKSLDFFSDGIHRLVSRWQKCIESDGNYFD